MASLSELVTLSSHFQGTFCCPKNSKKYVCTLSTFYTKSPPLFLYYKKGHIVRLLVNCGLSLFPFQVISQILTDQKLNSSTFNCCVFVCPSKSVTSPPLDHTNHTFLESLWLTHHPTQTHQAHHMAFWVSHSLLLSSFTNDYIVGCKPPFFSKYLCNHPFDPRYYLFLFYFWAS